MDQKRLNLLQGDIQAQIREIEKIYVRIGERKNKKGIANLESLGYQLHNLYCAFEDLFKIVADYFENNIEEKKKYHRELLVRMTVSIEGIRPALLSEESHKLLDSLRAFRHFFRHAYTYELEPKKVKIVLEDSLRLKPIYPRDIKSFLHKLGVS
ncbi:MAG: hypothetical protein ACE5R6_18090 [Candidatus Heimdallarchaeota archaeon]